MVNCVHSMLTIDLPNNVEVNNPLVYITYDLRRKRYICMKVVDGSKDLICYVQHTEIRISIHCGHQKASNT